MSGFVGLLSMTGEQVSRQAVDSLTRFLEFRGPDARSVWTNGMIGLGHALLRTGPEHRRERQPATLERNVWIVGDIRIDGRAELIAKLASQGRSVPIDTTSAELVLHAYEAWGHICVDHLLGDFAFVVWDAPRRTLFCARDQMGVKPFFYSRTSASFIVSNTLDCVRQHAEVPADLNDLAIADFLMFGYNLDPSSSAFAAIQRLPPAHAMTVTDGAVRCWRYWTMPIDEPIYLKRSGDYLGQFGELLTRSVRDRFGTDRLAVYMSGGLDSTLLAAEAKTQAGDRNAMVSAFTYVYDRLIQDDERQHATLVANHLGIPIHYWAMDSTMRPATSPLLSPVAPEPISQPDAFLVEQQHYQEIASQARVAFYGEGPDNALHYEWQPHLRFLWKERRWARMARDVAAHIVAHRRVPLVPTIPRMLVARRERKQWETAFPEWLNPELVQRLDLSRRWNEQMQPLTNVSPLHPVRPNGYRSMNVRLWQRLFDSVDAGWSHVALDVRHPYVDLRMLRFLLAVPAMPWCRTKLLLRRASRGRLPQRTLARPKTPLRADPGFACARGQTPLPSASQAAFIEHYVRIAALSATPSQSASLFALNSRPYDLGCWLQRIDA